MTALRVVLRGTQLRRTSRLAKRIDQTLAAMRSGLTLHLDHQAGGPRWSLSNGDPVTAEVAAFLTSNASVIPEGDGLFAGMSQTWRFTS